MTVPAAIREANVTTPFAVVCHRFAQGECIETTIHPAASVEDYKRIRKAFDPWGDKNKTCNMWSADGTRRYDAKGREV